MDMETKSAAERIARETIAACPLSYWKIDEPKLVGALAREMKDAARQGLDPEHWAGFFARTRLQDFRTDNIRTITV
jgi:hypothetical protein